MSEERMNDAHTSDATMSEENVEARAGDALHLTRLHVRSAPGIDDGGFVLDGLSPGVNVVFGPNGSGKTTTAAAIEAVLWPDAAARTRAALDARFTLDGVAWGARVEGRELRVQRDGQPVSPPAPPRADLSHRYRLHLHELLRAEQGDTDFAAEIVRASAGGWDVPGAAARLGFVSQQPKGASESKALTAARTRLAEAQGAERALQRDVERLGELEARLERARTAQHRIALLDAALAHLHRRHEHDEAAAALAVFDPRMAALHGDEMERIEQLDARAADARRRIEECERRRAEGEARQREALPAGALPDSLVPDLRARLGELDALRPRVDMAEKELAGAAEACESTRRALGDTVDEARLANVSLASLGDLARQAEETGRLRAERTVLERELASLEEGHEPPHTLDTLARGIAALEGWLAAPAPVVDDGARGARTHVIVAAVVTLVASALLFLLAGSTTAGRAAAGTTGLVAVVMLALALRRPVRAERGTDERATQVEIFTRLPLP
ncbi:MAG TPA: AAA family ATPase, partial [Gemmatimonadaceae bacterium]|nr:AAA family ATPase [Gemmatimonadaceae bacterium]